MNSYWNKNKTLFINRFPQLAALLKKDILTAGENPPPFWNIETAKNGSVTVRENGLLLHSAYNPEREAQQTAAAQTEADAAVFLSFGAGYLPDAYALQHPNTALLLIEPDVSHFIAAMQILDWEPVFTHPKCILAIGCPQNEVIQLINKFGIKNCAFFSQKNQTAHAQAFFDNLQKLIERNRSKETINNSTRERFSSLWLKNSCRNLRSFAECDGINLYENKAENLPAIVLAAGPSLADVLPYLAELKKRAIIICVDTALRACLRSHVEPDFIILVDPQYWAAQHLAGLSSPSSVLITESAAYPSVLRFNCRKIVFCSSFFPLGKYFEQQLGSKGKLDAGGSVATSAWDFARLTGASPVFMAGLDLGYPDKKTHIKGSTFEEALYRASSRIAPAETGNTASLYGVPAEYAKDYNGNSILTDQRMKLFAWWFESRLAAPDAVQTFTFCPQNLAIPGIKPMTIDSFLKTSSKTAERNAFFETSEKNAISESQKKELLRKFDESLLQMTESFQSLYETAKKGLKLVRIFT